MDLLCGKSCIEQCIYGLFPAKPKVVALYCRPVAILSFLPKFISVLEEGVPDDAIAYGPGNLKNLPCRMVRPTTVQPFTKASATVASLAAGLSLIESPTELVEKYQSKIAQGWMDIFPGLPLEVYVANFSASWFSLPKYGREVCI